MTQKDITTKIKRKKRRKGRKGKEKKGTEGQFNKQTNKRRGNMITENERGRKKRMESGNKQQENK